MTHATAHEIIVIITLILAFTIGAYCSVCAVDRAYLGLRGLVGVDRMRLSPLTLLFTETLVHLGLAYACAKWLVTLTNLVFF